MTLSAGEFRDALLEFINAEVSPDRSRVEALIYVQTCPELLPVVAEGRELAAANLLRCGAAAAASAALLLFRYCASLVFQRLSCSSGGSALHGHAFLSM